MTWMIYGANGYTAGLIIDKALARGHRPVLAGRHSQKVFEVAQAKGLPARIFDLSDEAAAVRQLEGISLVLHCAGPFSRTSRPMLDACVRAHVHYLDITGEIDVFEAIFARQPELEAAGIAAIPGVGFDVVPSDCLAALLKEKLPSADHLALAFAPRDSRTSPGTAKTMVEGLSKGGKIRRDGRIVTVPAAYHTRTVPFPDGPLLASTIPWGDVATAFHSTGIPNIEVYLGMTWMQIKGTRLAGKFRWLFATACVQNILKRGIERQVIGPSAERRARASMSLWGEARNAQGASVTLSLRTPDGYSLTADAAVRAVERLLKTPPSPGAQTPSLAFGADFIKELESVEIIANSPRSFR